MIYMVYHKDNCLGGFGSLKKCFNFIKRSGFPIREIYVVKVEGRTSTMLRLDNSGIYEI